MIKDVIRDIKSQHKEINCNICGGTVLTDYSNHKFVSLNTKDKDKIKPEMYLKCDFHICNSCTQIIVHDLFHKDIKTIIKTLRNSSYLATLLNGENEFDEHFSD